MHRVVEGIKQFGFVFILEVGMCHHPDFHLLAIALTFHFHLPFGLTTVGIEYGVCQYLRKTLGISIDIMLPSGRYQRKLKVVTLLLCFVDI